MPAKPKPRDIKARPNTVPWPPIVLIATVVAGWTLGSIIPTVAGYELTGRHGMNPWQVWVGWTVVVIAIAMDVWVLLIFKKHNTNIRPDRPAESLVTNGPFAYSRNPIYVGNVAIILGLSIARGSLWYLFLAPLTFLLIQELAIKREEAHMAARFGEAWTLYTSRVRRWI